mgnify:CR=1 FL=1
MNIKNRIAKLEKPAQQRGTWREFIEGKLPPEVWQRSIKTMAAALSELTGQPMTQTELESTLQRIGFTSGQSEAGNEQPRQQN